MDFFSGLLGLDADSKEKGEESAPKVEVGILDGLQQTMTGASSVLTHYSITRLYTLCPRVNVNVVIKPHVHVGAEFIINSRSLVGHKQEPLRCHHTPTTRSEGSSHPGCTLAMIRMRKVQSYSRVVGSRAVQL